MEMDARERIETAIGRTPGKDCGNAGTGIEHGGYVSELVRAGLDVARLNFSHGSHEQKAELIAMVRKVAGKKKPICILADLQGPKIRTGKLVDHKPVLLVAGKRLMITPETIEGTAERVSTVFTTLAENLKPGDQILLSDGLIELRVVEMPGRCGDGDCERRDAGGEQGDQSAGRGDQGAVADGEGRDRPGVCVGRRAPIRWRCRLCRRPRMCCM